MALLPEQCERTLLNSMIPYWVPIPLWLSRTLSKGLLQAAVFRLCGLKKSALTDSYCYGVIKNLPAFEYLILDWYIWNRGSKDVKKRLLSSIADMLDPNNQTSFF